LHIFDHFGCTSPGPSPDILADLKQFGNWHRAAMPAACH
jgi:hypothetical protein